jgi:hypothetical protein
MKPKWSLRRSLIFIHILIPSSSQKFNLKSTLMCSFFPIGKATKKNQLRIWGKPSRKMTNYSGDKQHMTKDDQILLRTHSWWRKHGLYLVWCGEKLQVEIKRKHTILKVKVDGLSTTNLWSFHIKHCDHNPKEFK